MQSHLAAGFFSTGEFAYDPAFPLWIMVPAFVLALGLIVYLCVAQIKIAPGKTVFILAVMRVTAVALLFVLLLRPFWRWMHTSYSSGTLWFLLDQSPSMASMDPQAADIEKLRWADALGYFPSKLRPYRPERDAAAVQCMRSDFAHLSNVIRGSSTAADAAAIESLVAKLDAFADDLEETITQVRKAPTPPFTAFTPLDAALRQARDLASAAAKLKPGDRISEITSHDALTAMSANIEGAARALEAHAAHIDAEFLSKHGGDSDIATGMAQVASLSRSELALQVITTAARRSGTNVPELLKKFRVRIATFSDAAAVGPSLDLMSAPDAFRAGLATNGNSTDISTGLRLIAEQLGPEEPAAVIVISDGRHNAPRGEPEQAARDLLNRKAPVHVHGLMIGSRQVTPDAAAEPPQTREWVFKDDTLSIVAPIRLDGLSGKTINVDLYRNGSKLDSKTLRAGQAQQDVQRVIFSDKPPEVAVYEYEVRIQPVPGESNIANNAQTFRVAVKKDKLFALMVEDQPRWEWQYLRMHLARDQRLKLQSVLLEPASIEGVRRPPRIKASPANEGLDAQILPDTREEWSAFDLIVLGDVGPEAIPEQTQQYIAAAVRDKGATLICIAGTENMPQRFVNGPLAEILPVTLAPAWEPAEHQAHSKDRLGFRPAITNEGDAVLRDFGLREASTVEGPPAPWEIWHWHSFYTSAKPGAQTVLTISENGKPVQKPAGRRSLVATMNVGLGKVLYLSSDQTWRWRYLAGENGQDRFWGQVIRWSVGADLPAGGKFVRFGAERQTYEQGIPVTITARVVHEDLTPYPGLSFSAVATPVARAGTTRPVGSVTEARFSEAPEAPGYYRATFSGLPAGQAEISLRGAEVERLLNTDPTVSQRSVVVSIMAHANREQANMNTDFARLNAITTAGGGVTLLGDSADVLAGHLPQIQATYKTPEQVGLFTDPNSRFTKYAHWGFLIIFAATLTLEWGMRKRNGMI